MSTASASEEGFFTFYREYAHTAIHSVTATALTAFGLLTFVHQGFVVLAIAVYILPPIYLYMTRDGEAPETVEDESSSEAADETDPTATGSAFADESTTESATKEMAGSDVTDGTISVANDVNAETQETDRDEEPEIEPSKYSEPTGSPASGPAPEIGAAADPEESEGTERDSTGEPAASGSTPSTEGRTDAETGADSTSETETERPKGGIEQSEVSPATGQAETDTETGAGSDSSESAVSEPVDESAGDRSASRSIADSEAAAEAEPEEREWVEADVPTEETLFDAVAAGGNAYVAGGNGVLLARNGEWEAALEHGPSAESTTLRGIDATADGAAVWTTGDSGVLGRYDPEAGRHTDHSAPRDITDNWIDIAVAGSGGEERVALVNGSGQVLTGTYDGSVVEWNEPIKPGSGSSMSAIEFIDEATGYCCDTNSGVYETPDGEEYERIGIDDGGAFTALAVADSETIAVAVDDGTIQRYDGSIWTPLRASENEISGLDTDGERWIAVGEGGAIREQRDGNWEPQEPATDTDLFGVAVGDVSVAVGENGTVLEHRAVGDDN